MLALPKEFIARARLALGDEAEEFLSVYSGPHYKGIRVNTLKISSDEFKRISPFPLEGVEWEKDGFYVSAEHVGLHPYHAAGLYYSQEPSAMLPAALLDVRAGEFVLDLCSAPGGKGTQMAQKMCGQGVIVMNEYVPSRAKILSQNVERLGIKNALVLNESPAALAEKFPCCFDKILVDAPCSGEGMFRRKSDEAISNWSVANVLSCAGRQKEILASAKKMLAVGGRMVYSTCTFSFEEDEGQIGEFLKENPEFIPEKEVKLLPHRAKGEGHYAAILKRTEGEKIAPVAARPCKEDKEVLLYRAFEREFLNISFPCLYRAGESLYALPAGMPAFAGLNALRAGVRLGGFVNGRFEPGHSLAVCLKKEECRNFVSLDLEGAQRFMRGESLPAPAGAANGWCAVGVGDYSLGLGKISGGIIKNHYPKGLRVVAQPIKG